MYRMSPFLPFVFALMTFSRPPPTISAPCYSFFPCFSFCSFPYVRALSLPAPQSSPAGHSCFLFKTLPAAPLSFSLGLFFSQFSFLPSYSPGRPTSASFCPLISWHGPTSPFFPVTSSTSFYCLPRCCVGSWLVDFFYTKKSLLSPSRYFGSLLPFYSRDGRGGIVYPSKNSILYSSFVQFYFQNFLIVTKISFFKRSTLSWSRQTRGWDHPSQPPPRVTISGSVSFSLVLPESFSVFADLPLFFYMYAFCFLHFLGSAHFTDLPPSCGLFPSGCSDFPLTQGGTFFPSDLFTLTGLTPFFFPVVYCSTS